MAKRSFGVLLNIRNNLVTGKNFIFGFSGEKRGFRGVSKFGINIFYVENFSIYCDKGIKLERLKNSSRLTAVEQIKYLQILVRNNIIIQGFDEA